MDFSDNKKKTDMRKIKIDGNEIELHEKEIVSCNTIKVSVGTTGKKGGDSGWGGRTILSIEDLGSSDLRCNVHGYEKDNSYPTMCEYEEADHIEIILGGDCELETFYTALKFAVEELGKYAKEVKEEGDE